jgi:hypothetical protein
MWCWRWVEKNIWKNRVKNEDYYIFSEALNILHTPKIRQENWIFHILRRNCLLKHFIEEKIDGKIKPRKGKE